MNSLKFEWIRPWGLNDSVDVIREQRENFCRDPDHGEAPAGGGRRAHLGTQPCWRGLRRGCSRPPEGLRRPGEPPHATTHTHPKQITRFASCQTQVIISSVDRCIRKKKQPKNKRRRTPTLEASSSSRDAPDMLAKFSTKFRGARKTRRTFSSAPDTNWKRPTVARHCMS